MANTLKNKIETLEIFFSKTEKEKVMIVDHARKAMCVVKGCKEVSFFNGDSFVLVKKNDGTSSLYRAAFGFILKDKPITEIEEMHLANFIAAIKFQEDKWYVVDIDGNLFEGNELLKILEDFVPIKEYSNGNILVYNENEHTYNILLPDLTLAVEDKLTAIGNECPNFMVLATNNGDGLYNILKDGKFVFNAWKCYIYVADKKIIVFDSDNQVSVYDNCLTLLGTQNFATEKQAWEYFAYFE